MTDRNTKRIIGESLKYWRKKNGLTQAMVSVDLDIPRISYQNLESGRTEPSIITLKNLANIYGLKNIEELIDLNLICKIDEC